MIYAENVLICIAIPLLLALVFIRGNARRYVGSFLSGMLICLLSAYISGFLGQAMNMGDGTGIYLSPLVEEFMKFLPLMLWLYLFAGTEEELFLVAVGVGTGFATFENCVYMLGDGAVDFAYMLIRGLAVGVMRCVSILILTIGIVTVMRYKVSRLPGIFGSLSLAMVFHALYNLIVSGGGKVSMIGYCLPILTALILYKPYIVLRKHHTDETEK